MYHGRMQLQHLVQLSRRLRAATRKNEKISLIADFLKQTAGEETALSALYLTGTLPQGKIEIGGRMLRAALSEEPASHSPLTLREVDDCFNRMADDGGTGSSGRKIAA